MAIYNDLPLYEAKINMNNDETGMFCISLVDEPATESNFIAFSKHKELITYSVQDEEQRKVFGLVMAADMPIYRIDENGREYYIIYSKETLAKMTEKYFAQGCQNNVDTMHNFMMVEGVNLTQMLIKNSEKGVVPKGFEEYADGSIFAEFKINNDNIWQSIKSGEYKGFSLAGYFEVEVKEDNNKEKEENKFMSKLKKIKSVLRSLLVEFGELSTDKGILTWQGDEELKVGDTVRGLDENGEDVAVADGEYTTDDNKTIVVVDGKVAEIVDTTEDVQEDEDVQEETNEEDVVDDNVADTDDETQDDEKDVRIKELEDLLAERDAEIAKLNERIKELEDEPAAKSAEVEFSKVVETEDNTPKGRMSKRGYKF